MAVNLNNSVDNVFRRMDIELPPEQTETIVTYIQNYLHQDGCVGTISWVAYRIWNAIKSIFGMSDWQAAIAVLTKSMLEKMQNGKHAELWASDAGKWAITQMASEGLNYVLEGVNIKDDTLTPEAQEEAREKLLNGFREKITEITQIFRERRQKEQPQAV